MNASLFRLWAGFAIAAILSGEAFAAEPWQDIKKSPEERARLLEQAMTQDERFSMLHTVIGASWKGEPKPEGALGSGGYMPGIKRLGIPALQETDAGMGVTNPLNTRLGDGATALPSNLATAATWNLSLARSGAKMVAGEARAKGFNVLLAGGVNPAREPRAGRNFEGYGEDPFLIGKMAGAAIDAYQQGGLISTIKHLAYNDQEISRHHYNVIVDEAAGRESDLLAFEIAMKDGQPGSVMCSYNRVNSLWGCQNPELLTTLLRKDWKYNGWVMSDWGAVQSPLDALAGLDQQSGAQLDPDIYFDKPLKAAVASGTVPQARIGEMVQRILVPMFRHGLFDPEPAPVIDTKANEAISRSVAEQAMVLLRNERNLLPLVAKSQKILVVGGRADAGVLQGGGSAFVVPNGGSPVVLPADGEGEMQRRSWVYLPSSPLKAIRARAPEAQVTYMAAGYPSAAAVAAKSADIVIVFVHQWTAESFDVPDLSLPDGQDELVAAVAAANPNTVVVIQSGGAVKMPWLSRVGAVLEAWYPGSGGGDAIADVLFGKVNPSGRLPISFPIDEADLPNPKLPGSDLPDNSMYDIVFHEGAHMGYKWYAKEGITPQFDLGYGLSYTHFDYSNVKISGETTPQVQFTLKNQGGRAGFETAQFYGRLVGADGIETPRLLGWEKVYLEPGEERRVTIKAEPKLLGAFSLDCRCWDIKPQGRLFWLGRSLNNRISEKEIKLKGRKIASEIGLN